jgi:hypothetical protein
MCGAKNAIENAPALPSACSAEWELGLAVEEEAEALAASVSGLGSKWCGTDGVRWTVYEGLASQVTSCFNE